MQTFYLIRLFFAAISSYVEARFYRTVTEEINIHVGRYVLVILFIGAGMFNASTGKTEQHIYVCVSLLI